jgi:hypothetical protein
MDPRMQLARLLINVCLLVLGVILVIDILALTQNRGWPFALLVAVGVVLLIVNWGGHDEHDQSNRRG